LSPDGGASLRLLECPLIFNNVIGEPKVMDTLFAVEKAYPRVGKSILDTFFPGKLRLKEERKWHECEELVNALDASWLMLTATPKLAQLRAMPKPITCKQMPKTEFKPIRRVSKLRLRLLPE
jgi:hypothetical protein